MTICSNCSIFQKLICCCGEHPETREKVKLEVDGEEFEACPHLTKEGLCGSYNNRPEICSEFHCQDLNPIK
jgi:Fe-S-cluster containining protein